MYDKIYKEIFLKSFVTEKKKVYQCVDDENVSVWKIQIFQQDFFITVYMDDIEEILTPEEKNKKEYEKRNEAELTHFRFKEFTTEKRVIANRLFLELLRRYAKEAKELSIIQ